MLTHCSEQTTCRHNPHRLAALQQITPQPEDHGGFVVEHDVSDEAATTTEIVDHVQVNTANRFGDLLETASVASSPVHAGDSAPDDVVAREEVAVETSGRAPPFPISASNTPHEETSVLLHPTQTRVRVPKTSRRLPRKLK